MTRRVGTKARQVDDGEFGIETVQFLRRGTNQQRTDEQIVPGELVDHPDVDAILGLRTAE